MSAQGFHGSCRAPPVPLSPGYACIWAGRRRTLTGSKLLAQVGALGARILGLPRLFERRMAYVLPHRPPMSEGQGVWLDGLPFQ